MTTPLDRAFAAMDAAPEDEIARLAFFGVLSAAELHLLLATDSEGADRITPEVFDTSDGPMVLAFDTEDRLTAFTGGVSPRATLSGRTLATRLAGQGLALGLNLDVAPSSQVLPAEAIDWLAATLAERPAETQARPTRLAAPSGVPERLVAALDQRLAATAGRAGSAFLASVTYDDGRRGHLLAFAGTTPGAETALAAAVGEALVFSGLDAGELDVAFLGDDDPVLERFAKVGLRFDLPEPERMVPVMPGSDPDAPPTLR